MGSIIRSVATLGPRRAARIARLRLNKAVLEREPWYATTDSSDDPAIIIGGCGRSGTTLLREMLNRHPRIACGPETAILCDLINPSRLAVEWETDKAAIESMIQESPSVVRFAERFFREFADREGKLRWADKTPRNVHALPRILSWFPNARFIHMLRDGRDVACSLRNHPRSAVRHGRIVPVTNDRPITDCARRWLNDTSLARAFREHPRRFEIRYERLVDDAESALRELCDFLREDFNPSMLSETRAVDRREGRLINNPQADKAVSRSSVGRWRRDLTMNERADFNRVAGELLIATGYAPDDSWINEPVDS